MTMDATKFCDDSRKDYDPCEMDPIDAMSFPISMSLVSLLMVIWLIKEVRTVFLFAYTLF